MKKKENGRIFFCIVVSLILITFLMTFSTAGCGRRAALKEKLKSNAESGQTLSVSGQSANENETIKENAGTDGKEKTIKEESTEQVSASSEAEKTTQGEDTVEEATDEETTEEDSTIEEQTDPEQESISKSISPISSESAAIAGDTAFPGGSFAVGDTSDNKEQWGGISYDISELSGSYISAASIEAMYSEKLGNPFDTYGPIIIKAVYWGKAFPTASARDNDGVELANFKQKDFTVENEILVDDLQKAVDSGSERYQIVLYYEMNGTDVDGTHDYISYLFENVILKVTFTPNSSRRD